MEGTLTTTINEPVDIVWTWSIVGGLYLTLGVILYTGVRQSVEGTRNLMLYIKAWSTFAWQNPALATVFASIPFIVLALLINIYDSVIYSNGTPGAMLAAITVPVFDSDSHGRIHFTPPSGQYRPGSSLRRHNVIVASSTRRKYLRGYDIRLRLARGSSHHRCRIRCHMAVRICGESDRRRNKKRQVVCSCSIRGTSLIAPRIRPTLGIFRRHTHTSSRSRCGFVPRFHP